jgi:hypothetical protein
MSMTPVIYRAVQQNPFAFHTGGNIGGVEAASESCDQLSKKPATIFTIQGRKAPGIPMVDWYQTLPLISRANRLTLEYDLWVDDRVAAQAWAQERDFKLTWLGRTGNLSFERVVRTGQLQISGAGGQWLDVPGAIVPTLDPTVSHHFEHRYAFDVLKGWVYSHLAINVDGEEFDIPPSMQNLPFLQTGWSNGALFQFQQDAVPDLEDPGFSETLDNCTATFFQE